MQPYVAAWGTILKCYVTWRLSVAMTTFHYLDERWGIDARPVATSWAPGASRFFSSYLFPKRASGISSVRTKPSNLRGLSKSRARLFGGHRSGIPRHRDHDPRGSREHGSTLHATVRGRACSAGRQRFARSLRAQPRDRRSLGNRIRRFIGFDEPGCSKQIWNARVDPKRRTHGVGTYTTVLDQWGIPYDQPLPLLQRQAGAAIEGVIRQRIVPISRLAVDTHGYTDLAQGLAKLLGFDLCPRQHDMREQWLHVPRAWPEIPELEPILKRDVDLNDIHAEYDELLRVAASIDEGYSSATYLLERLGSAARGSRLHHAGSQLGQLWRTVYLCDYCAQSAFRRTINRLLVRGESVHQLQRAIHYGPIRADRGRRREELSLISGALTLLTNAVIAYNTWKLNEVIEARRLTGRALPPDEILAHIAPVSFGHINFRGIYRFPLERYVDRLVPSMPVALKAVRA
jgi:TnpA family transposase